MDEKGERTLNGSRDGEEKPVSKAKAGDLLPSKVRRVVEHRQTTSTAFRYLHTRHHLCINLATLSLTRARG
jgi:hypothetical protein